MRLHQRRDTALDWRDGRRISRHERLVTLRRPAFPTFPTFPAFPAFPAFK